MIDMYRERDSIPFSFIAHQCNSTAHQCNSECLMKSKQTDVLRPVNQCSYIRVKRQGCFV